MKKNKYYEIIMNGSLFSNIFFNFFFKGIGIVLSFISVPLVLKYLEKENYGLWLLILSTTGWIYTFDIGLGNGLKNRIAESLAKKKNEDIREYIATAYFIVSVISIILFVLVYYFMGLINIKSVLNISFIDEKALNYILNINIGFVCLNFILSICNNIFLGVQRSYLTSINNVISQVLNIVFIILLQYFKYKSLAYISVFYGLSISLSHIILTVYFFIKEKKYIFSLKNIKLSKINFLFGIGGKIFFVQIAGFLIFSTDNFIIAHFLGANQVAEYNIAYKLFSIPVIILSLITGPIWPAVTKAFHENNIEWIEELLKKMKKIFLIICLITIILTLIAKPFIKVWTVGIVEVNILLILSLALSTILIAYSNIYSTIIFGINVNKKIVILCWIQAIINLIVSYVAIKYLKLGTIGVVLGTCFAMATNILILPKELKIRINKAKISVMEEK